MQQLSGGTERENPFTQWQSGGIDVRDEKKTDGKMGAPKMVKLLSQGNNKQLNQRTFF